MVIAMKKPGHLRAFFRRLNQDGKNLLSKFNPMRFKRNKKNSKSDAQAPLDEPIAKPENHSISLEELHANHKELTRLRHALIKKLEEKGLWPPPLKRRPKKKE